MAYLPQAFHLKATFTANLRIVTRRLTTELDSASILALGLIGRELSRAVEVEPRGGGSLPGWLKKSKFGIAELDLWHTVLVELQSDAGLPG